MSNIIFYFFEQKENKRTDNTWHSHYYEYILKFWNQYEMKAGSCYGAIVIEGKNNERTFFCEKNWDRERKKGILNLV